MTANRASSTEIDRQLPGWRRNLSRPRRTFRPRRGGRQPGAGAGGLRADAPVGAVQSRRHADRNRQRHRDVQPRLYRGAVQDRRHAARPRVRSGAGGPCRGAPRGVLGRRRRGRAPAPDRRGLCHAAAGAVSAAGRDRHRAGHCRLHGGPARARRDGGGAHPDSRPSHRAYGVAAALADASRTARWAWSIWWWSAPTLRKRAARFERFTGHKAQATKHSDSAIALDRGQVQLFSAGAFAAMFAEIAIPRLPFIGAYALRVQSLATVEALLQQERHADAPAGRGAGRAVPRRAWRRRMAVRRECRRSALAKLKRARYGNGEWSAR